jgi:hypothetical protein
VHIFYFISLSALLVLHSSSFSLLLQLPNALRLKQCISDVHNYMSVVQLLDCAVASTCVTAIYALL